MLRIGFDARLYGQKQRGLGRYVLMLLDNLVKQELDFKLFVFLSPDNFNEFQTSNSRVTKVLVSCHWYTAWEQVVMSYQSWKLGLDIFHVPHFNAPIFARGKIILTIHDLIINRFPDSRATTKNILIYKLKLSLYHLLLRLNLFRASKIIAVSKFTAAEIIHDYPATQGKIVIIYEAVYLAPVVSQPASLLPEITKPFLIYVGAAYPHKNLEQLIRGFEFFNQDHQHQLVLVGRLDFFYSRLKYSVTNPDIIFTGFLSDAELEYYFSKAKMFVFPSLYEGFGLPSLEAMSQNLVCTVSDIPVHREVLADSCGFFANTPEAMASTWQAILANELLINSYKSKALNNLKRFDYHKMTRETLSVYKSV